MSFYLAGHVRDYMSEGVITVEEDLPLPDAFELFSRYHFHGLPVVDREGRVAGILRDSDILSIFVRRDPAVANLRAVRDIMRTPPLTVSAGESAQKAVERMFSSQTRMLAVVDREGRPEAVITRTDLVRAIRAE